eukprot:4531614-Pyramimonas_sp.AAC.1
MPLTHVYCHLSDPLTPLLKALNPVCRSPRRSPLARHLASRARGTRLRAGNDTWHPLTSWRRKLADTLILYVALCDVRRISTDRAAFLRV